jgi:prepilin-type N-terminal cleavage/methylation domain-containing protein
MRPLNQRGFTIVEVLAAVGLIAVLCAITIPITMGSIDRNRLRGDAQALNNMVGLAKMRASSGFTRVRLRANLTDRTFLIERWNKDDAAWVAVGGVMTLSNAVTFGFGELVTPPPNSQAALELSPACRLGLDGDSDAIDDTACITFNSRGLPIDGSGLLFGGHALYLTDGIITWGITITATPRIRLWSTAATQVNWSEQQ